MNPRKEKRLDMLPLLDVFMVILFVFATIQEGQLSATTEESDQLTKELQDAVTERDELKEKVDEEKLQQQEDDLEKTKNALQAEQDQNVELQDDLKKEKEKVDDLEDKEKMQQDKIEELQAKAMEEIEKTFPSQDDARTQDVLEKLLDQHSVYELEIQGVLDETRGVVNLCCYRTDPRTERWQKCGEIPTTTVEQEEWFKQGGRGLLKALRATKGGNAMTIIRHDHVASHRIGEKLESLIRGQVDDQKVYNEGISPLAMSCQK